jgi:hypothetical protein
MTAAPSGWNATSTREACTAHAVGATIGGCSVHRAIFRPTEVHGHTCEGAGAALRTGLRSVRGVHQRYLHRYVATYEAIVNAKRVTLYLIRRMCVGHVSAHTDYS